MKNFVPAALLLSFVFAGSAEGQTGNDPHFEIARRVLQAAPLFDGHNDLPWAIRRTSGGAGDVEAYGLLKGAPGNTDIPRMRQGLVGAQFWSVYVPVREIENGAARFQLEQIDIAKQVFARYPETFREVRSPGEVASAVSDGRIASVVGMEGGHAIENSLAALRAFYNLGARYMTLTHSVNTDWADAAGADPAHHGLTEFGREVVREMNWLGMLVDLSHVATSTMHDVLDVAEAPVIFSHTAARAIADRPSNVPDDVLRRLPENGGIAMITFIPGLVSQARMDWAALPAEVRSQREPPVVTMDDVIRHIEHARAVAGVDHVGIGSDFNGISQVPVGLEDVSKFPALFAELSRRGWSEEDLRKLAGENILRVWTEAERVSMKLQGERGPSTATIEEMDGPRAL